MKIDFKSKKTRIVIGAVALAIVLALAVTITIINSNNKKQNSLNNKVVVDPVVSDIDAKIKAIDDVLTRVNVELGKVKVKSVKDSLTKYNIYGMDDYFTTMKVDKIDAAMFNFVNEDIYLVKITPVPDAVTIQTYYYKNNEFTALDIESQGSGSITRYYIYKQTVIAEKSIVDVNPELNGKVKMYIDPVKFATEEIMLAAALDNYNYSKDESIKTQGEALSLAYEAVINTKDTVRFEKMEMIANKEYYVFQELSSDKLLDNGKPVTTAWICIEKQTGTPMYKDSSVSGNVLITKDLWLQKNETIMLKLYYINIDQLATTPKDYEINKATYNKEIGKELMTVMNQELGLGINSITIVGGKAVVDVSTKAAETVFATTSKGSVIATESLTKTIFANTIATIITVTVDGKEKVASNSFSLVNEFIK